MVVTLRLLFFVGFSRASHDKTSDDGICQPSYHFEPRLSLKKNRRLAQPCNRAIKCWTIFSHLRDERSLQSIFTPKAINQDLRERASLQHLKNAGRFAAFSGRPNS